MRFYKITILFAVIILSGCNSNTKTETNTEKTTKSESEAKKIVSDSIIQKGTENAEEDEIGCVRGEATPVLKKSKFPDAKFQLHPDKISATETLTFKNGDKLIIENTGCESYVLEFNFNTSRFAGDTTDAYLWAEHAAVLLNEIITGIDAPMDVPKGLTLLQENLQKSVRFEYGDEVDFGGEDIRSYVKLEQTQKLSGKRYNIRLTFITGPL